MQGFNAFPEDLFLYAVKRERKPFLNVKSGRPLRKTWLWRIQETLDWSASVEGKNDTDNWFLLIVRAPLPKNKTNIRYVNLHLSYWVKC